MARVYGKRRSNPEVKTKGSRGFAKGLNQISSPTAIKDNELAEAQNVNYIENGVVEKRPGSINLGSVRGSSTKIYSLKGVYGIGGADYFIRISDDGIAQRYSFGSSTWVDIAGSPTFSVVRTTILQAYSSVYFLNPDDTMVKWDGTTWTTFTALANPSVDPTIAKTGSATGTTTWYYKYLWENEVGHTGSSNSDSLGSMPDELDSSTYITVTLPAAPSGTIRTSIYRGTIDGEEIFLTSIPASQTTFDDKGFFEPDPLYAAPTDNTTAGLQFKFAEVYNDTLIGVATNLFSDLSANDYYLAFSAGGDKFDSFGRADGGGYYGWRVGDGDPINGLHSFQSKLYTFKRQKVGAFTFDESGGSVQDINLAVGAVSHNSIHAAGNDLRFWSNEGAMSLGNEPNFADIIRTKVLSAKADRTVQAMTAKDFPNISGVYYKGVSLWGIPLGEPDEGITSTLAYFEKYVAWSEWVGLTPNIWSKFIDEDNVENIYYGDAKSGNVVQCWQGTHDRGSAIVYRVATKQWDLDVPFRYKAVGRAYLIFNSVTGTNTDVTVVEDGERSTINAPVYGNTGEQGFGIDMWGDVEFGDSSGEYSGDTTGLLIRYIDIEKDVLSIQIIVQNDGITDQIALAGVYFDYSLSDADLPSEWGLRRTN
jgi:hypothetical protein